MRTITLMALITALVMTGCGDGGKSHSEIEREISHACDPMKNVDVDYHSSGWSVSSRYEITCADGSQRIVFP